MMLLSLLKGFFEFIRYNWISGLAIFCLVIVLLNVDQGQALVVDILEHQPVQVVIMLFQSFFLALVLGYFPVYLQFKYEDDNIKNSAVLWKMHVYWKLFTTVYFKVKSFKAKPKHILLAALRKVLGFGFLVCLFYVFAETLKNQVFQYGENDKEEWLLVLYLFVVGIGFWLLFLLNQREEKNERRLIDLKLNRTLISLLILASLITIAAAFISISASGWSVTSLFFTLSLLILSMIWYVVFSIFRRDLKLSFLFSRYILKNVTDDEAKEDIAFNILIGISGCFNVFLLVYAQFWAHALSPILLFLALLHILYGLPILTLKYAFYYSQNLGKNNNSIKDTMLANGTILLPVLLVSWYAISEYNGNELHSLKLQTFEKKDVMDFEAYQRHFDIQFAGQDTLYMIAAYGGGLKANLWNQYVLQQLDSLQILNKTVAISGVSGGALGNAFYAALQHEESDPIIREVMIDSMGKGNFLSGDIAYMFGHDMFMNLWPWAKAGTNRSYQSLKLYQNYILSNTVLSRNKLLEKPFQVYWNEMQKGGNHYPVLLMNTAGRHNQKGVACSIRLSSSEFNTCFNNAVDILDFSDNHTLSYMEAVSTTNRFPVVSPAAKIPGKGHFVDGGYYENSGLSSLFDFYLFLRKKGLIKRETMVKFLQISNDKTTFIHKTLNLDGMFEKNIERNISSSAELQSMISTKLSLSFTPLYYAELMKNLAYNEDLACLSTGNIAMPYEVSWDDLKEYYHADDVCPQEVKEVIELNNAKIKSKRSAEATLFIEPPLSRLLAPQSLNYMKGFVKDAVEDGLKNGSK